MYIYTHAVPLLTSLLHHDLQCRRPRGEQDLAYVLDLHEAVHWQACVTVVVGPRALVKHVPVVSLQGLETYVPEDVTTTVALLPENRNKNRYTEVVPCALYRSTEHPIM